MGYYINPNGKTKEAWLLDNGVQQHTTPTWDMIPNEHLPVCLMDNGAFTAAGIAYCKDELEAFSDPRDQRPKLWFVVPINCLLDVEPSLAEVI